MDDEFLAEFPDSDVSELIGLDAHQQHDLLVSMRMNGTKLNLAGSKQRLINSLKRKNGPTKEAASNNALDPIASAMEDHPGLTREKAEEMAKAFGF